MVYFFIFYLGAITGSFLLCIGEDWADGKIDLWRRSACPTCQTTLSILDLFPIFSQLALKNRCRYCKSPIGFKNLAYEVIVGFVFLLIAYINEETVYIIVETLLACILILMSIIDLKARWAPDSLQLITLVLILTLSYLDSSSWPSKFNIIFSLMFILFGILAQDYIGGADVKLIASLSLIIAPANLGLFLFIASLLGIAHYFVFAKKNNGSIPFVPMIATSFLLIRFYY